MRPSTSSGTQSFSLTHTKPIVFVVDDDISVREALEGLIRDADRSELPSIFITDHGDIPTFADLVNQATRLGLSR